MWSYLLCLTLISMLRSRQLSRISCVIWWSTDSRRRRKINWSSWLLLRISIFLRDTRISSISLNRSCSKNLFPLMSRIISLKRFYALRNRNEVFVILRSYTSSWFSIIFELFTRITRRLIWIDWRNCLAFLWMKRKTNSAKCRTRNLLCVRLIDFKVLLTLERRDSKMISLMTGRMMSIKFFLSLIIHPISLSAKKISILLLIENAIKNFTKHTRNKKETLSDHDSLPFSILHCDCLSILYICQTHFAFD